MQWLEAVPQGSQFGPRLLARHAGLKATLHIESTIGAVLKRVLGQRVQALPHHERHVEVRSNVLVDAGEGFRGDADDVEVYAVDPHGAVQDQRVGSELGAPEIVGQDHNGVAPRDLPLVRQEASAEHGSNAHHLVEVVADHHADAELRSLTCRFRHAKGGEL